MFEIDLSETLGERNRVQFSRAFAKVFSVVAFCAMCTKQLSEFEENDAKCAILVLFCEIFVTQCVLTPASFFCEKAWQSDGFMLLKYCS